MTMAETHEGTRPVEPGNRDLSEALARIAELLEAQGADRFRVAAYCRAATAVAALPSPVADVFAAGGVEALQRLPGIGPAIAGLVREYARTGRISLLDRLAGDAAAEEVFARVPGLGPTLTHRIHEELGIETLEELECACHDGRLTELRGFGARRVQAVAAWLGSHLGREGWRRRHGRERPSVAALLDVDAEYRRRARAGGLARIAPRRFNPERRAWLPILHTEREGWTVTALFSNSERAHRLGRTGDWVVIHAERHGVHDQCTVVWQRVDGELRRVVRGRERERERE